MCKCRGGSACCCDTQGACVATLPRLAKLTLLTNSEFLLSQYFHGQMAAGKVVIDCACNRPLMRMIEHQTERQSSSSEFKLTEVSKFLQAFTRCAGHPWLRVATCGIGPRALNSRSGCGSHLTLHTSNGTTLNTNSTSTRGSIF